jgi:hypothetical protein
MRELCVFAYGVCSTVAMGVGAWPHAIALKSVIACEREHESYVCDTLCDRGCKRVALNMEKWPSLLNSSMQ